MYARFHGNGDYEKWFNNSQLHLPEALSCAALAIVLFSTMFRIKQMMATRRLGGTATADNSSKQLNTVLMQK